MTHTDALLVVVLLSLLLLIVWHYLDKLHHQADAILELLEEIHGYAGDTTDELVWVLELRCSSGKRREVGGSGAWSRGYGRSRDGSVGGAGLQWPALLGP